MTKKDYKLFARCISKYDNYSDTKQLLIKFTSEIFNNDNSRFNLEKYLEACNNS
jgi:hypothetical protein